MRKKIISRQKKNRKQCRVHLREGSLLTTRGQVGNTEEKEICAEIFIALCGTQRAKKPALAMGRAHCLGFWGQGHKKQATSGVGFYIGRAPGRYVYV